MPFLLAFHISLLSIPSRSAFSNESVSTTLTKTPISVIRAIRCLQMSQLITLLKFKAKTLKGKGQALILYLKYFIIFFSKFKNQEGVNRLVNPFSGA